MPATALAGTRTMVAKRPSGCTSALATCVPSGHATVIAAPTGQLVPRIGSVPPGEADPPLSVGGRGVGVGSGVGVVVVGPTAKPIPGSGAKSAVSGVPLALGCGDAERGTTFTGALATIVSGPRPLALSAPRGEALTSIVDKNLSPG